MTESSETWTHWRRHRRTLAVAVTVALDGREGLVSEGLASFLVYFTNPQISAFVLLP